MANYSQEIAEIEAILNSGQTRVTVDGQTVVHDLDALRKRLRVLKQLDDNSVARRRPTHMRIDLSSF